MKHIDENKIEHLLKAARQTTSEELNAILKRSESLERLTLEETASLLAVEDPEGIRKILETASRVKDKIYGKRVVIFAPLYVSNVCANACLYCAFKKDNPKIKRKVLTIPEIKEEVACLLKQGHKRILLVAGEASGSGRSNVQYYADAIKAIYSVRVGSHKIKRVNINCAPLSVEEFRELKAAHIGTYQLFQETYHEATYREVHPVGPKSDPDNRLSAVDRAFQAGIDDVGIGVLYGLYDYKFETLAMLMHVEYLEKKFKVGPHTISVPRLEPATGVEFVEKTPWKVSDQDFKKLVAILRLAVPYTGIVLSTRETPEMRDELFNLGISQISAGSKTNPGGYSSDDTSEMDTQFHLSDHRSLDDVMSSLIERGFIPSFCAACYRKERTGEAFMKMAKPGTIKGKCHFNAVVTLKEYLDDFASPKVKAAGYKLIEKARKGLNEEEAEKLECFFANIEQGTRDEYV
jgi:2-iminoacetate synthase